MYFRISYSRPGYSYASVILFHLRFPLRIPKYINTNLSTFISGKRSREEGDDRDALSAYALLNLSLIAKEFFKTMEIQGTVFNLLDKDYSDPGPTAIPDDLPRPGRTYFVGLSYQF